MAGAASCSINAYCRPPAPVKRWVESVGFEGAPDTHALLPGAVLVGLQQPWSSAERVKLLIEKQITCFALELLPRIAQVQELLTPTSIAIMTGVFAAWAVSHAVGVGAVADVLLAALGVAYLGLDAIRAAKLLYGFLNHCMPPAPPGAIDDAAREFSQLVTLVGIDIVSMILLGKAFKKARQKLEKKPSAAPERGKAEDRAPAERTPGEKAPGERAPGERAPGERAPEAKVNDKVGGSPLDPIRGAAIPGAAKTPWPLVVAGGVLLAAGALTLVLHGSSSPPRRRLRDEDEDT